MAHDQQSGCSIILSQSSTILLALMMILILVAPAAMGTNIYGLADADGKILKQPCFAGLQFVKPNCYLVSDPEKKPVQLIIKDKQLLELPEPSLPVPQSGGVATGRLSDDLVVFENGGKKGVCDSSGKIVLEPKFSDVGYAGDGIISVTDQSDFRFPCKLYNSKGQFLFKTTHGAYRGQKFSEGLLNVGSWGERVAYYNTEGKVKISGAITSGEPFHDGLAAVTIATREITGAGYINHNGELVIGPFKNATVQGFDRGFGVVTVYTYDFNGQSAPHCGVTDRNGKMVIPTEYQSISRLSNSFFVGEKDSEFYLLHQDGQVVFKFPKRCVAVEATNSDALDQLIPCAFEKTSKPAEPYEKPEHSRKWGFCDMHGTMQIEPIYAHVESFERGLAAVFEHGEKNNRAGLIRPDGSFRLPKIFSGITRYPDGNYIVYKDNRLSEPDKQSLRSKKTEEAFPLALREHNLIGMPKDELVGMLGEGKESTYKRPGIPDDIKETIQYQLYAGKVGCANAARWLEFGFNSSGNLSGWRNIGFQWEGKWCRENVVFPTNKSDFDLNQAIPKSSVNSEHEG